MNMLNNQPGDLVADRRVAHTALILWTKRQFTSWSRWRKMEREFVALLGIVHTSKKLIDGLVPQFNTFELWLISSK